MSHTILPVNAAFARPVGSVRQIMPKPLGSEWENSKAPLFRQTQILQSNDLTFRMFVFLALMINEEASLSEVNRELCELHTT